MAEQQWMLKRNCSISPRQLARFYASLCFVSLLLATIFTLGGAWLVLVFSVVELSAVGAAFLYYARHACDRECIWLAGNDLVVELVESDRTRQLRFDISTLRIEAPGLPSALIRIRSGSSQVEVGRYLPYYKRREFASELRQSLIRTGCN
ncbi:DUF2244 domain-containing protein [Actimicrobium sp. CCI2.3]|uniref:DUF2244 domain-containing protein n=1 Tax=Actimicrobium sp. CCI2.3 TaxID=3048616 RepID=UPI002AB56FC2|nr:DUF2244 domain-containing protein [Actimicrobium sp. CCI2.3]MDY7576304.1 DUF2244 domain-containing protein [Actimicrobium sp. CCI2.3]MEB0020492.1 DUF2244 domain-containing protein [Actimicrobium sp. CCI2.3]